MEESEEIRSVTILIPRTLSQQITAVAKKRMSNFSQVFREAALKGLELMK